MNCNLAAECQHLTPGIYYSTISWSTSNLSCSCFYFVIFWQSLCKLGYLLAIAWAKSVESTDMVELVPVISYIICYHECLPVSIAVQMLRPEWNLVVCLVQVHSCTLVRFISTQITQVMTLNISNTPVSIAIVLRRPQAVCRAGMGCPHTFESGK